MTRAAKSDAPVFIGFRVSAAAHRWLAQLARDAGDFDADTCARGLLERLIADDMAAHGVAPAPDPEEDQQ